MSESSEALPASSSGHSRVLWTLELKLKHVPPKVLVGIVCAQLASEQSWNQQILSAILRVRVIITEFSGAGVAQTKQIQCRIKHSTLEWLRGSAMVCKYFGGTSAGLLVREGELLGIATCEMCTRQPAPGQFKQRQEVFGRACCDSPRGALSPASQAQKGILVWLGHFLQFNLLAVGDWCPYTLAAVGSALPNDSETPHRAGKMTFNFSVKCHDRVVEEPRQ